MPPTVSADLHLDRRGYLMPPTVVDDLVLRLQVAEPGAVVVASDLGLRAAGRSRGNW